MILVYYNLSLSLVVLTIISISTENIVLTKLIAGIWEHGNIASTKSHEAKLSSGHMMKQVVNKPPG